MIPNVGLLKRPLSKEVRREIKKYLLNDSSPDIRGHYRRMYTAYDDVLKLLKEQRRLIHLWYTSYKFGHEKREFKDKIKFLEYSQES